MVNSYTVVWSLKEGQAKSHAKSCDKIMLKIWPLLEIMQKVKLRWDIVVWFEGRSNWEEEEGWRESQGVISTFIFLIFIIDHHHDVPHRAHHHDHHDQDDADQMWREVCEAAGYQEVCALARAAR